MKISIGADHRGYEVKEYLKNYLVSLGNEVYDEGTDTDLPADYPVYASRVARKVASGGAERGILVCGSGMGMCIAANKIKGVRGAVARDPEDAELTVRHNGTNVLCLGSGRLSPEKAGLIAESFLGARFEGGRHERRLRQITDMENEL